MANAPVDPRSSMSRARAAALLRCTVDDVGLLARAGHLRELPEGRIERIDVVRLMTAAYGGCGMGLVCLGAGVLGLITGAVAEELWPRQAALPEPIVPVIVQATLAGCIVWLVASVLIWQRLIVRPMVRAHVRRLLASARARDT